MGIEHDNNFKSLYNRIIDTNNKTDLERIRQQLLDINESVICVGIGGSSVVSEFASKVFIESNNCIAVNKEPRDLIYDKLIGLKMCLYVVIVGKIMVLRLL